MGGELKFVCVILADVLVIASSSRPHNYDMEHLGHLLVRGGELCRLR